MYRGILLVAGLAVLFAVGAGVWLARSPDAPPAEPTGEVRIAAASSLTLACDDVIAAFRQRHPDLTVRVSYGSSGNFFAQLSNRAPFDLFLSADVDYPRRLVEQGLAAPDDLFVYAVGHLVVWVPSSSPLKATKPTIPDLLDPAVRKVALANPRYAPYGRAAVAALKHFDVYDRLHDRLVLGENIAQTAQFAEQGVADAALLSLSLALAPTLHGKGRYAEVPADAYPRLEQGGVILARAGDRQAAETLRDFLRGPAGQAILKRYGFSVPGGE